MNSTRSVAAVLAWVLAPLAAAAVAGAVIWYFGFHGHSTPVTHGTQGLPHVTPAQVLRNSQRWSGKTVVLAGDFGQQYGPHSFTVSVALAQGPPGNRGLLVVANSVPQVGRKNPLRITGKVERLPAQSAGLATRVSRSVHRRFRGDLVVVARSISKG